MSTEASFSQADLLSLFGDPAVRADPYPLYHRLREADPVHRSFVGFWILSRYEDCVAVLHDPRHSSDERNVTGYQGPASPTAFHELFYRLLLFRDDPDHARLRGLVQKAFTRRVIESMRPRVEAIVAATLDELAGEPSFDLMPTFAYSVPVTVICELLGVPVVDRDRFRAWAHDLTGRFEIQPLRTPEGEARGDAATEALIDYFEELIAERRRDPRDDLLSELIAAEEAGERLQPDELYATCILLLMAGHE
ncbi:MAG: cytochrome P450, partial [Candidatus Binatia bacterium]